MLKKTIMYEMLDINDSTTGWIWGKIDKSKISS